MQLYGLHRIDAFQIYKPREQHRLYGGNTIYVNTTNEQKVKHNIQCLCRVKAENEHTKYSPKPFIQHFI